MFLSHCPRCHETFRLPAGELQPQVQARCPWCRERFPLAEVLGQLPPELEILDEIVGFELVDEEAELPTGPSIDDPPFAEQVGDDLAGSDEAIPAIIIRNGGEERPDSPPASPSAGGTRSQAMRVQPGSEIALRHKRGRSPWVRSLIGIAVGPLLALPLAGAILLALNRAPDLGFYPFDGSFDKNARQGGPAARSPREVAPPAHTDGRPAEGRRSAKPSSGRSLAADLGSEDRERYRSGPVDPAAEDALRQILRRDDPPSLRPPGDDRDGAADAPGEAGAEDRPADDFGVRIADAPMNRRRPADPVPATDRRAPDDPPVVIEFEDPADAPSPTRPESPTATDGTEPTDETVSDVMVSDETASAERSEPGRGAEVAEQAKGMRRPTAEEGLAEKRPEQKAPAEEGPAEEAPAEETPAEEALAEEALAEEAPAEEAPAEEGPAEEGPKSDADAGSGPPVDREGSPDRLSPVADPAVGVSDEPIPSAPTGPSAEMPPTDTPSGAASPIPTRDVAPEATSPASASDPSAAAETPDQGAAAEPSPPTADDDSSPTASLAKAASRADLAAARARALERLDSLDETDPEDSTAWRRSLAVAYQAVAQVASLAEGGDRRDVDAVLRRVRRAGLLDTFGSAAVDWFRVSPRNRRTDGIFLVGQVEKGESGDRLRVGDRISVVLESGDGDRSLAPGRQVILGRILDDRPSPAVEWFFAEPFDR